jgi:hypothetical protein
VAALLRCPDGRVSVVELRQYTLRPGARDTLIELFDREFVTGQEAAGIDVIGQFRDLDDPDRFVWLRGFPDLAARRHALETFYGGPVWKRHRDAANATMIDSDNVLLLRPARPGSGFDAARSGSAKGPVVATVLPVGPHDDPVAVFEREVEPALGEPAAVYVTDPGPNDFPALPVREGENVVVWFASGVAPPLDGAEVLKLEPTPGSRLR